MGWRLFFNGYSFFMVIHFCMMPIFYTFVPWLKSKNNKNRERDENRSRNF